MQPDIDHHESVVDLALAVVHYRAVLRRKGREGDTPLVRRAEAHAQDAVACATGAVYRAFGLDTLVLEEARWLADRFDEQAARIVPEAYREAM